MAEEHPLALLAYASTLLQTSRPRRVSPIEATTGDQPDLPNVNEILEMFVESGEPQTQALAWAISHLAEDELSRAKVTRSVDRARLPRWLAGLGGAEVSGALQTQDAVRDGTNIVLGLRVGGHDLSLITLIDHNAGTIVKDSFAIPAGLGEFREVWHRADPHHATEVRRLTPADARAWLEPALEHGDLTWPPYESETWPAIRPLLDWALRHCPAGGFGFDRLELTDAEQAQLIEDFVRDKAGRPFDDPEHRDLLDSLMWFGTGYGYGDPLLLSPTKIEILLLDWVPRKIVANVEYLTKLPALLTAFVPYGHRLRSIPQSDTDDTLEQVKKLTPEYLTLINRPRRQGPEALLEQMGVYDATSDDEYFIGVLAEQVGGRGRLDALNGEPLLDETLDLTGLPNDIQDRVRAVAELCDACCEELFDRECRTAVRRLLHDVAAGDPQIFRRRGRDETAAAALCWLVGRTNTVMDPGRMQSQQLMAYFGLKGSPSQRAEPMRQAIGLPGYYVGRSDLGSDRYLTGETRRELMIRRDRWLAADEA